MCSLGTPTGGGNLPEEAHREPTTAEVENGRGLIENRRTLQRGPTSTQDHSSANPFQGCPFISDWAIGEQSDLVELKVDGIG